MVDGGFEEERLMEEKLHGVIYRFFRHGEPVVDNVYVFHCIQ